MHNLLEILSDIIKEGKEEAAKWLAAAESDSPPSLTAQEWIYPDSNRLTSAPEQPNRIICGDNLHALAALLAGDPHSGQPSIRGQVDLIYIDPPFDSKADYRAKIMLPGDRGERKGAVIERFAYSDQWENGTVSYLRMMTSRLALMREMLSERGSLYVHLDWHAVHYVKLILDELFGRDRFLNEIVWCYKSGGVSKRSFARKHDTILLYTKSEQYVFNPQQEKSYMMPGSGKNPAQTYYEDENGRYTLVQSRDWWSDIGMLATSSRERVGYATQKPERLLERIIQASTEEGMLVADFFSGSGTTAAVAERLGRRWIATDIGQPAVIAAQKRLIRQGAAPFLRQSIAANAGEKETFPSGNANEQPAVSQRLTMQPPLVEERFDGTVDIVIELTGYTPLCTRTAALDGSAERLLMELADEDPLALIGYVSVDPDYDGAVFCGRKQLFRDQLSRGKEITDTLTRIELTAPRKEGPRAIAVKIIDLFGNESMCVCLFPSCSS